MRSLNSNPNVDNSDMVKYPNGRIKDDTGAGDGTGVNERTKGDFHQMLEKLMRLYGIAPNDLPDNETNGFQLIDALRALASKNDFVLSLGTSGGILQVPIKLNSMLVDEQVVCKASANLTTETQIKGSDLATFNITSLGSFKANEYVRLIKTASTILLVRMADFVSLDSMVSDLFFLKKASQAEENAGTIDTKGTTPFSNKTVFQRRVNGADSPLYLATASVDGLYPKAHFSIVSSLTSARNKGWFSGLNVGAGATSLSVNGQFSSAQQEAVVENGSSSILVTMANAMDNTDYEVSISVESQGAVYDDLDSYSHVFRPVSTTQFRVYFSKSSNQTTSLKVHLTVNQL
jgi:hypothetical protein